jgi:hypothetical protein
MPVIVVAVTKSAGDAMIFSFLPKRKRPQMALSSETQELVSRAERVYEEMLKTRLEAEHLGSLIALNPVTGEYVLANTFRDIDVAAQKKFGNQPVHIFRIGGGGAVKVGGVGRHARVS